MAAVVTTPVFEGPVDVLLQLVGEHRVDIYDIPLADVAAAFVRRLAETAVLDLDEATEFLVIVAILVEMKSRRLLPGPDDVDEDEEIDGYEERDRLLGRLLELQAYGAAADVLAQMFERASRSLPRCAGLEEQFRDLAPDLLAGVTPADLARAFRRALTPRPAPVIDLSHVTVEPVTVSEAVEELVAQLPGRGRATFRELTWHCTTRMQIIVRFLGLLELCKRGWVTLEQGDTFGDLEVAWVAPDDVGPVEAGFEEYDG
jgi:segregation and condensation protein A